MSVVHPITGVTSLELAGERRTLACDMNAAAALYELVGENWSEWLVNRFVGEKVEEGRKVQPLTPGDTVVALYALLASDREDSSREESVKSLHRSLPIAGMANVQLALVKSVLSGFGLPGEYIEAVVNAAGGPR